MHYRELDTPAVVIDTDIVGANIARAQALVTPNGPALRPHIKTHKLPEMARLQVAAGAKGITCQKVSEAEIFTAAGFDDIFITYNIIGAAKLKRLRALNDAIILKVVADSAAVVDGLSAAFADAAKPLTVLVECDTGQGRCGVQSPEAARDLATYIHAAKGLRFGGLMTYPAPDSDAKVDAFLAESRDLCVAATGLCETISSGGTPSMATSTKSKIITEYRPGTYIYNDRSLMARGTATLEDCALVILARVISRPTPTRAIMDAGSKSLTSDLLGLNGYGLIREYPEAVIVGLSEEHGQIDLGGCSDRPAIGDLITIIPNHVCPVSNLYDVVHLQRKGEVIESLKVAARGCVY